VNEQNRLVIISNNLANSATSGYKQENTASQSFRDVLTVKIRDGSDGYANRGIGTMNLGVKIGETYTDFGQGALRQIGGTYDLGISGNGFFPISVTDMNGNQNIRYTRDGNFKLTQDGFLTDSLGNRLQGLSGDIRIPTDATEVAIDRMGFISADGQVIDRITLVDFTDYDYLSKVGDTMYQPVDGATLVAADGLIMQGYIEQSNVNVVSEMVEMITVTRAFEANQKVTQTTDTMLEKSVNSIGKL
jgi:flagellar basal-body rod protein FlgG